MQINDMKQKLNGYGCYFKSHIQEVLTILAIAVGVFSASSHIFLGSWGWSGLFLLIGSAVGLFLPSKTDMWVKKIYGFSTGQNVSTSVAMEVAKIAVALFVPFIYFCFFGALAGTAFQYYLKKNNQK